MYRSDPPKFELSLKRIMPTPGWTMQVDAVEIDEDAQRIIVKVTEVRPRGAAAQVVTADRLRIKIGVIPPGQYFVEIWRRSSQNRGYDPSDSLVIAAG